MEVPLLVDDTVVTTGAGSFGGAGVEGGGE